MDYAVCGLFQVRILEWEAFPFSRGSSQPGDQAHVSCIADSLPTEPSGKPTILRTGLKEKGKHQL